VFAREETHHFDGGGARAQSSEELFGLPDRRAIIPLAVDDEQGRLDSAGIGQRRVTLIHVRHLAGVSPKIFGEHASDFRCAPQAYEIGRRSHGDRSFEASGMTDRIGGEVAAVAAAGDVAARCID